jgi:chemotaxis protein methyltransferase CheR
MIDVAEPWLTATVSDAAHGLPQAIYLQLAAVIRASTGTELGEDGLCLMWNRLRPRLAELGCISFAAYLALVQRSPSERDHMVERMCTHETRFFREPEHFAWISEQLAPSWRAQADRGMRARRVRAWSAACSSGEEPFTLAMVLRSALPIAEGWAIEVVATDVSRAVLAQAQTATWPIERAAAIPPALLRAYMLRGFDDREGTFRARPELRALVSFRQHNLVDHPPADLGDFDLVMCRNVLIYFPRDEHAAVVGRLLERLPAGGHLIVGHAESLLGKRRDLVGVEPTIYRYQPRSRRRSTRRSTRG